MGEHALDLRVATAVSRTSLLCLSVSGCRVPLPLLEALSFTRDEIGDALLDLRRRSGCASQLALISTCERVELYAAWSEESDPSSLLQALADNRELPLPVVQEAAALTTDRQAARHLLRVTAGLESFVLGESDILAQVRMAARASRAAGAGGLELERLMATAVNTSRRVHRSTSFGEAGRSVAAAAVQLAAVENGHDLADRKVLVVGAGDVATQVADTAARLGATVTVCNRTKRHAERLAAAGAEVVDLSRLEDALATTDVAIFGTAAPHALLTAAQLDRARRGRTRPLLVIDLCVPRNVDSAVRDSSGVKLVDLADLRATGAVESEAVTRDVVRAEQIVEEELDRFLRWRTGRSAAASVRRLRADVEACVRSQVEPTTLGIPEDLRPVLEERVRRAVQRLAHGPTKRLLEAAEAGDDALVEALAGLFAAPSTQQCEHRGDLSSA